MSLGYSNLYHSTTLLKYSNIKRNKNKKAASCHLSRQHSGTNTGRLLKSSTMSSKSETEPRGGIFNESQQSASNWFRIHEKARNNEMLRQQHQHQQHQQHQQQEATSILRGSATKPVLESSPSTILRKSATFSTSRPLKKTLSTGDGGGGSGGGGDVTETRDAFVAYSSRKPFWGVSGSACSESGAQSERNGIRSLGDLLPCLKVGSKCLGVIQCIVFAKFWRTLVLGFDGVSLFMPQIRDLACPKESDVAFDVLFMVTVLVLFADIVLMSYAVPHYFTFRIAGPDDRHTSRTSFCCGWNMKFGGFVFWFDVISALTLLHDISFFNTGLTRYATIDIFVDENGSLVSTVSLRMVEF